MVSLSNENKVGELKLPFYHFDDKSQPYRYNSLPIPLDWDSLDQALKKSFAQPKGWASIVSLFTLVMSRYSGQEEIPLGLQVTSTACEQENSALFTLKVDSELTFAEWLQGIQVDLTRNEHAQSAQVNKVATYIEKNRMPSTQIGFYADRLNGELLNEEIADSTTRLMSLKSRILSAEKNPDLLLICQFGKAQINLELMYNENCFAPQSMQLLVSHLQHLITQFNDLAHQKLSLVEFLTAAEQIQLEAFANGGGKDFSSQAMHRRIERIAAENPDAIAARFESEELSYAELNIAANQLANFLLQQGIQSGNKVVVTVDPGFEILIALLAIFKINATYVPIDPAFPQQRIDTILADVEPAAVVTITRYQALFTQKSVFFLDELSAELSQLNGDNLQREVPLDAIAYIFYTSGTTGKPKGVMASYANLIQFICSAQQVYNITAADVMPSCARFTFSISIFELMFPLCHGATLQLLTREHILNMEKMSQTLARLTFLHMGPSLLKLLLLYVKENYSNNKCFKGLRHISSGGDMVQPEVMNLAQNLFPGAECFVIYGCSEISCMGCTWRVPVGRELSRTFVGKPFNNTRVLLVDSNNLPVALGIPGEICFCGNGVVKGYLNNETLTQDKFFNYQGKRYYRTGDFGKFSYQGELEILGRADFQIQLNGIRIEPTEIEFFIKQYPDIKDCVVTLSKDSSLNSKLIAYYVSNSQEDIASSQIKQFLAQSIPEYMLPSQFIRIDALPLNFNLKVDRNALINRKLAVVEGGCGELPVTELEKQLAEIWREVLSIEFISREDNFFEIGGDSLSAVIMTMRVERQLGLSIYGLDVARETLAVIALKLSGVKSAAQSLVSSNKTRHYQIETFFFGERSELFGVCYRPTVEQKKPAVLICQSIGQEQIRCEFLQKKISADLTKLGHTVFFFDHYASGNSKGKDIEASLARWQSDQQVAYHHLKKLTDCDRPIILGVRLGGRIALETFGSETIEKLVLWDPIISGTTYLQSLKNCHTRLIKKMRNIKLFTHWLTRYRANQWVGFRYNDGLVSAIKSLESLDSIAEKRFPVVTLFSKGVALEMQNLAIDLKQNNANRYILFDDDCGWYDTEQTEKAITNHRIARQVVEQIAETTND